jgi:hypothetical protein
MRKSFRSTSGVTMTSELLKVLVLPAVLAGAVILAVVAGRHGMSALAIWILVAGWLLAGVGLTVVARETQPWPLVGYLENLAVFLGLCAVPFLVAYGASAWLQARGAAAAMQLGLTLALALLAILPASLGGPYWAVFLGSVLGWEYIRYP